MKRLVVLLPLFFCACSCNKEKLPDLQVPDYLNTNFYHDNVGNYGYVSVEQYCPLPFSVYNTNYGCQLYNPGPVIAWGAAIKNEFYSVDRMENGLLTRHYWNSTPGVIPCFPLPLISGEKITIYKLVVNAGEGDGDYGKSNLNVSIVQRDGRTGSRLNSQTGNVDVTRIPAGQYKVVKYTGEYLPDSTGSFANWVVRFIADSEGKVPESNEENNNAEDSLIRWH